MTIERSRSRQCGSGRLGTTLLVLSLLSLPLGASGAEAASLRLFHGPDEAGTMSLKTLRIVLDGKDLGVSAPASDADPARALYTGSVAAGVHKLEVEAVLENAKTVFSYMDGYRIKIRSTVEVEVLPGEGFAIRSRIVPRGDVTTKWSERNRLVLTLSAAERPLNPPPVAAAEPAPVAPAEPPPAVARAPEPPPAEAPTPAPSVAPAPAPEAAPVPAVAAAPAPSPARPARVASAPVEPPRPQPRAAPLVAAAPAPVERAPAPEPRAAGTGACQLAPLRFEFGAVALTADARAELDRFAACVAPTAIRIRVEGHTDPRGTEEFNRWLAWDRAAAVSAYLRGQGLAHRRVVTRFVGTGRPVCAEATEECYARNRRVELVTE